MGAESATSPIAGGVVGGVAGLGAVLLKRIFGRQ